MAITIDWPTQIINVPLADLTPVSGTLYDLDVDVFRLRLKELEASEEGMPYPTTHTHNTEVTVAGVTYARTVEIINGYRVQFENGLYTVRLVGANNNLFDVENNILVRNSVSVISTNSAGLQVVDSGVSNCPTAEDIWSYPDRTLTDYHDSDIAVAVWAAIRDLNKDSDSFGEIVNEVLTVKRYLIHKD